jgi:aminoglycoside 6'-N-acetyltransferase I
MSIKVMVLGRNDGDVLTRVAAGVFDCAVRPELCAQFLADPRHHLIVAVESGVVVGMASGVHYVHPDKAPELWINEVGVAPTYQNRRIARQLLGALLDVGRQHGCTEAWVLTERANAPAMRLYASCGGRETEAVVFTFKLTDPPEEVGK